MQIETNLRYDLQWTCFSEAMKDTYANSLEKISAQMFDLGFQSYIQLVDNDLDCGVNKTKCESGCPNYEGHN